ncbi:MFS transporter [Streptosporangium sp. NPDC003464]
MNKSKRRWWALAALVLTSLAVGFDMTILNLALPAMAEDLHADNAQLQWFITAYTLTFAAGMIPAGMLGDRLGRRRMLLAGLIIFGLSSLVAAYATSVGMFIAARAVLGVGAALIMPTVIALLPALFEVEERPKAIGTLAGASMLAYPIGPTLGGWLLNHFWWGSVFLINIPVVIIAVAAVLAWLPESRAEQARRIDCSLLSGTHLSRQRRLRSSPSRKLSPAVATGLDRRQATATLPAGQRRDDLGPALLTVPVGDGYGRAGGKCRPRICATRAVRLPSRSLARW